MTRRGTNRLITATFLGGTGLIVALLSGQPEAAVMVVPWAVLLVLGFSNSQLGEAEITVAVDQPRLIAGDEVTVTTTVAGMNGTVEVSILVGDAFWPDESEDDPRDAARVDDVILREKASVPMTLSATEWGVHDLGRVKVRVTEPYGLYRWTYEVEEPKLVHIHPEPTQLQNLLAPWLVRRVTGAHRSSLVGRGVEYADIRLFAPGDSLREINWKATARSDDLWISQRHPDRATDVILLVDSFIESGHDVRTIFGLTIEGAVALAESHLAVADRVGLVELGGVVRWFSPGAGRHHLQRLTDGLLSTGLHSHIADRNLALLMSRALPPRSFVVALTPLLDDRFIDALFVLSGHGHDVAVIECETVTNATDEPTDETSQLAKRLWQAERQMIRDRLAEHGVAVARWRQGDHLDLALVELTNRRRRVVTARHRR